MKATTIHPNELVIKVVPSTIGRGKQLETVVFDEMKKKNASYISGAMIHTSTEKVEGGGNRRQGQDSFSFGFLKGNPLLERIKYFTESQRSWPERIFWFLAFLLSLTTAVRLIYRVWNEEAKVPVIVTFQSEKQDIDSIPFPAVTLCNMNQFPKSKVKELERIARSPSHQNYKEARHELTFVSSVCNGYQSFAKHFSFAHKRARNQVNLTESDAITGDLQDDMMDFLIKNTQSCSQLIRLCKLGEQTVKCSDLFKPVITDHGKCCTFNMLPLPLLLKNPDNLENTTFYENPILGNDPQTFWPIEEISKWTQWNYDEDGFVLAEDSNPYPWKQKRAGLPFGLSVLVDPDVDEYFCPTSDSRGLRYILHSPLERPNVMALASVAGLNKEVLVEVHPDMTVADADLKEISSAKRKCYFGTERKLKFFGPYTDGNCMEECVVSFLSQKCNCTFFYMPRFDGVRICSTDPDSVDFSCIHHARLALQLKMKVKCGHCAPLCEDIAYNYETTAAELQDKKELWLDSDPKAFNNDSMSPDWIYNQVSILHFFFGSESIVPKLRKRRYAITDLIANTGGVLGLCIGFSVLSAVEILYFVIFRSCRKYCRIQRLFRRIFQRVIVKKISSSYKNHRVISVNPMIIPVYSSK